MRMRAIVSSVLSVVVMLGVLKLSPIAIAGWLPLPEAFYSTKSNTARLLIGKIGRGSSLELEQVNDLELKGLVMLPSHTVGRTIPLGTSINRSLVISPFGAVAPFTLSALTGEATPARFKLKGVAATTIIVELTVTPVASSLASFTFGEISFVKGTIDGGTTTWAKALTLGDSGGNFVSHRSTDAISSLFSADATSSLFTMDATVPLSVSDDDFVETIAGDTTATARKVYLELVSASNWANLAIGGTIMFAPGAIRPTALTTISTMAVTVKLP